VIFPFIFKTDNVVLSYLDKTYEYYNEIINIKYLHFIYRN